MIISILGCGWLGLALGKHLCKIKNYTVKGSTTSQIKLAAIAEAGMIPFRVDLEQEVPLEFFKSDIVVVTVPPSSGNYAGKLEKISKFLGAEGVKKVLFTSTTSVYPNTQAEVVETDAAYVKSPHSGVVMLAMEDILRKSSDFETTFIRFAGLYGPGRHPGRFLAGKSGLKGAQNPVNLVHQQDCVAILTEVILQDCWGETFNACANEHPSREVFYTQAAKSLGLPAPQFTGESAPYKIINSDKLRKMLGYRYLHPDPIKSL